jgi:glycosyltransferase involved in cell wall biosynthesis
VIESDEFWIVAGPVGAVGEESGKRPRIDFQVLAERCDARILTGYPAPAALPGSKVVRVTRSLARNVVAASRWLDDIPRNGTVYSTGETWGLAVALAARFKRRRDLIHVVYGHRIYSEAWLRALASLRSVLHVSAWICVTEAQSAALRSRLGLASDAALAISQGVDTSFFEPALATPSGEQGRLLTVGAEMRDFPLLFAAVADLPIRAVCKVGSSWMRGARVKVAAPPHNVSVIRERLNYTELRSLYAGSSLVVVPLIDTLQAAGITTILEAMAMGKCVVATRSAGLPDILAHGRTGLIADPTPKGLRAQIERALADTSLRAELGAAARSSVRKSCSLERYAERVAAFLALTRQRRRSRDPSP